MPGTGYSFTSWKGSGTGSYTGTNNPAAITMSSPVFDTAQFTLRTYTITVTQGPNGTVAPGSLIVNFGTDQTFVFTPALGYRVDSVIVDGAKLPTSTTSYTFTNVIANHTLRVTFAINLFTIVAVTDGNGTISPSGLISMGYGGNQEFDFTPATGYHVDSILVDGVSQPVAPSYTFVNVISDHSIRVTFARNQYTITSSAGVNGSISPLGAQTLHYGDSMEFTFVPDDRYQVDSVIIDGTNVGPSPSFKFTNVTASHTIRVTFAVAQAYQTMYRTFTYDELPVKRSIKKRPYDDYWEFTIKNTWNTPVIQINLFFSYPVWQLISSGGLLPSGSNRVWTFRGTLNPGDSVVLKGRCAKIIHQKIIKLWFDPSFGTPVLKNVLPTKEIWEYPMPNVANVRETAFIQAKTTTGFVVGIPRPDSIRKYGWVRIWNSPMMYRSMFSRGLHIGTPRGFDMFSNNTPFTREQRGLIPSRQNNRLFADLLALKFNIWVSDLGITMSGLGDLRFVESGNPYTQLLVRQIAARADSLMTFHVSDPLRYRKLDSTVQQINASFSGPFDTTCWSTQPGVGIICKGARSLFSVPFLQAGGATPEQIPLFAGQPTVPLGFELSQNYPNPFNPTTTIDFMLPSTSIVALRVYNVLGQEVNVLVNGETMEAGLQEVEFNGNNLSSGVYFYRLTAEYQDQNGSLRRESLVRKMMLMK